MKAWPPPPWIGSSGLLRSTDATPAECVDWLTFYKSLSPEERVHYEREFPRPIHGLYDTFRQMATNAQSARLIEKMWGNTTFK